MNQRIVTIAGLCLAVALAGCARPPVETSEAQAPPPPAKRGEYLVTALGCDDCHTPKTMTPQGPVPDMTRRLAGHWADAKLPEPPKLPEGPWGVITTMELTAWSGPWGISYAVNLTPDEITGMGIWTEEMFMQAIRTGKHLGQSRPILPPMPWMSYAKLTDDDLKAVYAFLRTLPPVSNRVPDPVIVLPPAATP